MSSGNIEAIYPLTPTQEGILFHTLYAPGSPLYLQQYTCTIEGPLDITRFREAWDAVIRRHAVLRSLITWEGREQPLQIVREVVTPEWHIEDWSGEEFVEQLLDEFLAEDRRRGLALEVAPLMRFGVFGIAPDRHRFVWTHHHIVLDGWSMGIVLDEVFSAYESLAAGQAPDLGEPAAYREFVRWMRRRPADGDEEFWTAYLDGIESTTSLRVEAAPPDSPWASDQEELTVALDEPATARLVDLARRNELTLNTLVRGAWAVVLSRYGGSDDVIFGTTHAGRPPELAGALDMVGLFITTLPVRARLDGSTTLGPWLAALQDEQIAASDHEATPLADVQRWSNVPAGSPLFETLLVFENVPHPEGAGGTIRTSGVRYLQRSNYPLAILVMPGPELELHLLYDRQRFDSAVIDRLGRQFLHVLESLEKAWSAPVEALGIFPPEEEDEILRHWNHTAAPYPDSTIDQLIFEAGRASPDTAAVVGAEVTLSYAELLDRADVLAGRLRAGGVGLGSRVGVCFERGPAMISAILGVLRAGAAYVPLDPDLPEGRLELLIGPSSALVAPAGLDTAFAGTRPVIRLTTDGSVDGDQADDCLAADPSSTPDELAYVLHTSGSTGTPKAVAVRHRNLVASTHARRLVYGDDPPVFLLLSPFIFDSSVAGIFSTLTLGGTLVLPGPRMEQDVVHLARLVQEHQVTQTLCLPTVYGLMLELAGPEMLSSLDVVMVAGEACPPSLVSVHHQLRPGARLVNEYGPTECTVWCTFAELLPPQANRLRVPIGRPIANAVAYVLDEQRRPCPVGVPGELHVGGAGLAAGYLDRSDLTSERFFALTVPGSEPVDVYRTGDLARWLPDGNLELLGRIDHQVKIRGQRIEIEEVEAVLRSHPSVAEVAVRLFEPHGAPALSAVVEAPSVPSDLREFAAEHLPPAMVPAALQHVERLPRGPTGKVDRAALPEATLPARSGEAAFRPPEGQREQQLADLWQEVLGLDRVGAGDNFFELGGDSISSIRVIARARAVGLIITPRQFFEHPTVGALAAAASAAD